MEESCFRQRLDNYETICFWSTNVLTLYDIKKHSDANEHSDVRADETDTGDNFIGLQVPLVGGQDENDPGKPTPLIMNGSEWYHRANAYVERMLGVDVDGDDDQDTYFDSDGSSSQGKSRENNDLEQEGGVDPVVSNDFEPQNNVSQQSSQEQYETNGSSSTSEKEPLHFTFRTDLSEDLVPTVNAVCARYFYSAVVYAQTTEGKGIVIQAPFTVVIPSQNNSDPDKPHSQRDLNSGSSGLSQKDIAGTKANISIGTIHALAHRTPYLLPLSITYKAEPWSISVKRRPQTYHHHHPNSHKINMQSITIQEGGYICGTLNILGGGITSPGNTVNLQMDFASPQEAQDQGISGILPCFQFSACLQGEEYAIDIHGKKKKCRSYVFDTDEEKIFPGVTTSASLSLNVPVHCPISISTDFVQITITCRIDLTVQTPNAVAEPIGTSKKNSYRFLTVQFPCNVIQSAPDIEPNENGLSAALENQLLDLKWPMEEYPAQRSMVTSEVLNDLNMLSLNQLSWQETTGDLSANPMIQQSS